MTYNYKQIWTISYPILIGLLMQQLIGVTDTAFLGRVGEIELGASAIAGVFYIMIFMLGYGFSVGVQIIVGRRNGEKNYQNIGPIIYQGIMFLMSAATITVALLWQWAPLMLKEAISSPDVSRVAWEYLQPRIFGFFFAFIMIVLRAFYIGITQTKILSINALLMLAVNVLLDYILIFGKCGIEPMGIRGAAIASVLSEACSALFFVLYTIYKIDLKRYGFNKVEIWNNQILQQILKISVWTMLQSLLSLGTWLLFMLAIEHLGERQLAISNVLRSISSLPYMIVAALYGSANSITSNLVGMKRNGEIKETTKKIIILGFSIGIMFEMLLMAFPMQVMRIYTDNIELISKAVPAFYVSLSTYITLVPGLICIGIISGVGKTKNAMLIELISSAVYTLNIVYTVLYLKADIAWCWSCEHSYNCMLGIICFWYIKKNHWFIANKYITKA